MFSALNKCGSAELFGPKLGSANFSTLAFGGRFRGSSTCLTAEGFPGSMLEWISNGLFGPPTGPGRTQVERTDQHHGNRYHPAAATSLLQPHRTGQCGSSGL